ncbi:probable phosphomutase, MSMEG_4193 family [Georgenia satyanarayanai]|uniref:Probable phosphomutase, MSMEG_4193 family n=1 Tax=Georgenia satyanarayanai TaxID=860221 RepID=A0A2Y8ZYK2_9MICO|nr:MSMEG_4193 family putative phosphomutase [Georgenia satyanarayanai]PYG02249.1 putative phosphomutase (TIGR03848 family) [Georgenia satyanarayanai]SSA37095.1 probable phosphomutase, MSMEG_4193 family [Georgenia satyanarayanai]
MATVILVRHARSTANTAGVLAGRTPGVELDGTGREQAARTGVRLGAVPLVAVVSSPLERCRQTAQAVLDHQDADLATRLEDDLTECDYGDWQGGTLADLAKQDLWSVVQRQPSAAVFPGGESLVAMHARAVGAIRRIDAAVEAEHGPAAVWAAVTHGDLLKAVLADALGLHLDLFQRLHADPASASIVRYTPSQPHVLAVNTQAGDLSWLRARPDEPQVGGGAGPAASAPAS